MDPGLLSPFYADNEAFHRLARMSYQLLNLLMERVTDRGYFSDPAKPIFITDSTEQDESVKR